MSLYGNFTLKEWLGIHCATGYVDELFRRALKDNDEPMSVLALAELIKRGDIDLVTYAIQDATNAGHIAPGSRFSTVFTNALARCGSRDPVLRLISNNVRKIGFWPKTSVELLDGATAANCKHLVSQNDTRSSDDRLDKFLESFVRDGCFLVELGFFIPGKEWDPHDKEFVPTNIGRYYSLVIRNGFVLNREEIPDILNVLDDAGIMDPLPAFDGKELDYYALVGGNWVHPSEDEKTPFFYTSYFSVD